MSLFDFRKKKKGGDTGILEQWTSARAPISKDNPVDFDSSLVNELKKDHAQFLALIDRLLVLADKGDHDEINQLLSKFYADIKLHLMRENTKLFLYLSVYAKKEKREDLVSLMEEAKETGHMLVKFCEEFMVGNKFESQNCHDIKEKIKSIRDIFLKRATKEETRLFPMYREK